MRVTTAEIKHGDCFEVVQEFPDNHFDLIITSPPYADRRKHSYPTNVLHLATECSNKSHSAAFPEALPEWFIKLFTNEGDWVLDPFVGSGTTCAVSLRLGRHSIGIEKLKEYVELAQASVQPVDLKLLDKRRKDEKNKN